jgi:small subunit ribosomal protein S16
MDSRSPRDGKTIEEIGTYDTMIRDTDQRVSLDGERYDYWLSVGALPTDQVKRLAEKYKGKVPAVRVDQRKTRDALNLPLKAEVRRRRPEPPAPPAEEPTAEAPAEEEAASAEAPAVEAAETPAAE